MQITSVQLLSRTLLSATPWTAAHQASLSVTNSQSLFKCMSIKLVMPFNHLIFCSPLLLLPSIFPSIRVFSNESVLHNRWPKYWSFSFSISPSNESVQFSRSVVSDSLQPHDCSMPGLPVHHQLLEFTQTHVHWVGDAIQPSHPLLSPSPPVFNLSQHQGLFKWVSFSHQVARVLELQLQQQSFQWMFRTDFL